MPHYHLILRAEVCKSHARSTTEKRLVVQYSSNIVIRWWSCILTSLIVVVLADKCCTAAEPPARVFRVQDYGAVGNGTTLDTAAIQKAIDACSSSGGGTVCLSPGVYLSGTVFLKDNVRLFLEPNAVLRGSPRTEDYPPVTRKDVCGKPAFVIPPFSGGGFLIYADGVRNASIEGRGVIDGQGPEFWHQEMLSPLVRKPKPQRPRAMIGIVKGESLLFRDVTLTNSPCFTLWLIGCDNVKINAITIRNPRNGPNTDGIDIDCCRKVCVSDCSIDGGDDAIAIKSDAGLLAEDHPCEDITVSNCVLSSGPACGIRVGYEGDAVIRNCAFSNLTIYDTDIGLDIVSVRPGGTIRKGTRCENIAFNNIVMRNVGKAIYFWMGHEKGGESQVSVKNISVSNVIAQSQFGSYIGGFPQQKAEDITLTNVRLILAGKMPEKAPLTGSGVWGGVNPYALYCSHVNGLQISDFSIDFRRASGAWRHALFCEETHDARINGIHTQGFAALSGQAVIGLSKSAAAIRNSDAEPAVPALLHAANGSKASLFACDPTQAKTPFVKNDTSTISESGCRKSD